MKKLLAFFLVVLSAIAFNRCNPYDTVTVTGVALNSKTLDLAPGKTATLTATVIPDYATNKNVTWESSDEAVAKVDKNTGEITAVKAGTAIITVTTIDGGKTATCAVTVTSSAPATVPVTGVSLNKSNLTLIKGASETLNATITPENATNQDVTWTSNATEVATVDDKGKVTAVAVGTTNIVVTTKDGNFIATCEVTVTSSAPALTPLTFTVGKGENAVAFNMLPVEAGTFQMGGSSTHQVTLTQDYYIGKFEVTQGLWMAVMSKDNPSYKNPSYFTSAKGYTDDLQRPVECVSWDDICGTGGFLDKLNTMLEDQLDGMEFVLPTEAQWEFAAAGGKAGYNADGTRKHKYAGSDIIDNVAWKYNNSGSKTHEVGKKTANGLGICDMSGNVYEWCADWYGPYGNEAVIDPTGPTTESNPYHRVLRGGSWNSYADFCTVSYRNDNYPDSHDYIYGFRLALVP